MAHVGQEIALGAVCLLGGLLGAHQLVGAVPHLLIELGGELLKLLVQGLLLRERVLQFLVRLAEAALRPVDVIDQLGGFLHRSG